VRGALITIKCHCGELNRVPYGERWECPGCGLHWNTSQIPADEYWGIMRRMRRFRVRVIVLALSLGVAAVVLAVIYRPIVVLLVPALVAGWQIWYMPMWRRRVRQATRSLEGWTLTPDMDGPQPGQ
jgi:hypothetical protein